MDLGILNTVIALVIVFLVLSLLVQSIQTFIKKLLKLKSKQIADSLMDLYEQAIGTTPPVTPAAAENTAAAANAPGGETGTPAPSQAELFKDRVLEQFKNIGRKTAFGRPVLDSLSKQDLFKVMGKLELERFFPEYVTKFEDLCNHVATLRTTIEDLSKNDSLRGSASNKVAEIRAILAPIFTNVQAVIDGQQVKSKVLFADLLRLGKLNIKDLLTLLDEAQAAITQEKEAAAQANNADEVQQLELLSGGLVKVAKMIGDFSQKFDEAVSPLRHKLEQVEIWFDTVTQSFDERYARHMRTVSICISIVVVIVLNANFFRVYRSISTNEVQRNLIVDSGPEILKQAREARAATGEIATSTTPAATPAATPVTTESPTPSPSASPTPSPTPPPPAGTENTNTTANIQTSDTTAANTAGDKTAAAKPTPSPVNIREEIERTRQEIDLLSNTYQGLGFTPLSGAQVRSFLWSTGIWTAFWDGKGKDNKKEPAWWGFTLARNDKGVPVNEYNVAVASDCQEVDKNGQPLVDSQKRPINCTPAWRLQSRGEWWESLKGDVVTLIGWAIMVMLLSVGAPFWQDTLESLFGIKNLLRQRSATQNIETKSGAGQPKE
ncbi:MAG TPA: hypothetical protein VFZ22_22510 [Pyrinomonadaceae bacterium]|nr:hypothetical protein [Pyrinomonadaceae bacterium]